WRDAVVCRPRHAAVANLDGNQYERQLGRSALGEAEGDGTAPDASPSEQSGGTRWHVGHGLRPCPTYTEINTASDLVGRGTAPDATPSEQSGGTRWNVGHGPRPCPTYTEIDTGGSSVGRTRRSRGRRDSAGCVAIRATWRYAMACWPRPAAVSNRHGNRYWRQLGRSHAAKPRATGQRRMRRHQSKLAVRDGMLATARGRVQPTRKSILAAAR